MTTNVGAVDRIVRIIIGVALIALAAGYIPGYSPQYWAWIGLVPLLTGVAGYCPVYTVLGMSTCKTT